jgi:hypothetical protein
MSNVTYRTMSTRLVDAVPEIADMVARQRQEWAPEEPGQHNLYSEIVVPYIVSLLTEHADAGIVQRLFDHLEALADSPDEDAENVFCVTVVEELVGLFPETVMLAQPFMGPETRKTFDEYDAQLRGMHSSS